MSSPNSGRAVACPARSASSPCSRAWWSPSRTGKAKLSAGSAPVVIVGGGQGGLQIAESLRQKKYEGPITLRGPEPHAPYNRPPLSKKWLLERPDIATLAIRGPEALQRRHIELQRHCTVTAIDRRAQEVPCADGRRFAYGGLAIATGAALRTLPPPRAQRAGIHCLRTIEDAQAISAALDACSAHGRPLVVIGGGFIGLEVAATARKRGVEVTVLESLSRLMSRVVAPIVSEAAARVHRSHGVQLRFDVNIAELLGTNGAVRAVRCADGSEYAAGCVVIGVGIHPEDLLAPAAGPEDHPAILGDQVSRTRGPRILGAGDCPPARRVAR